MKKTLSKVLSLILCFSVVFSYSFYAFADEVTEDNVINDQTVADQVTDLDATPSQDDAEVVTDVVNDEAVPADEADDESDNQTKDEADKTDDSSVDPVDDETESEPEPQDLTVTADDDAVITIRAPAGALPEGATVKAETIGFFGKIGMKNAIEEAVEANDAELVSFKAYDITIYDGDEVVQPEGDVTVSIKGTGLESEGNVYHVSDDNTTVEAVKGTADDDEAEFTTDHFSIYVVTAENAPATYIFNVNGTESTQVIRDGETLYEPEVAAQAHKRFVGWYDENGDKFDSFGVQSDVPNNTTVTLTARYEDVKYVYFMSSTADDASVVATKELTEGDTVTTDDVDVESSTGMLTGWYSDKAGTTKVESLTFDVLVDDAVLYPQFAEGHWLYFNSNGGKYIEPVFYEADETTVVPTEPTKAGYTFKGWVDADEKAYSFGETLSESTTLTAKWEAGTAKYTIIYWQENANDSNYSAAEVIDAPPGTTGEAPNVTEQKDKYASAGFTYNEAKTNEANAGLVIAGDGSTIVNIYYTRNTYTVYWGAEAKRICNKTEHIHDSDCYKKLICERWHWHNDNCYITVSTPQCGKSAHEHVVTCYNVTKYKYTTTAKHGQYIGDKWPVENGKRGFWYVDNGTSTKKTSQGYLEIMPVGGKVFFGSKDVGNDHADYYKEKIDSNDSSKTYNYVLDHSDYVSGGYVTEEERYDMTGFTCNRELSAKDGVEFKTNPKFYYTRNSYDLIYMVDGTKVKESSIKYEDLLSKYNYTPDVPEDKPEGTTFAGWYDNAPCNGEAYELDGKTMPAHSITLYAKWNVPERTVTAITDDEKVITVSYGSKISESDLPEVTAPDGQSFVGWIIKETGAPFNMDTVIEKNYTIVPKFVGEKAAYTVTYTDGTTSSADNRKYQSGSYAKLKNNSFTAPEGKVFIGWKAADGTVYQPEDKIEIAANTVLTAEWGDIPGTVSVTYNANNGTGDAVTVNNLTDNSIVANKSADECGFSKTGYTLVGWGTTADATTSIFAKNGATVRVDTLEGSNTLYAIWEAKTDTNYTVEHYFQNVDNDGYTIDSEATETKTGTTGQQTEAEAKTVTGFTAKSFSQATIAADGSTAVKIYYDRNTYTVEYDLNGGTSSTAQLKYTGIRYGADTPTVAAPAKTGYKFDGWNPAVAGTVTADAVYTALWKAKTDTKYTVEYYYQQEGEYPEEATSSDERTGTTGATAAVTEEDKTAAAGYVYDTAAVNVESGTIAGDGSLVLKVYFKQQFTVTFKPGDHGAFNDTESTYDYGDTVEVPEHPADGNYLFMGWDLTVVETVTANAEYTALWELDELEDPSVDPDPETTGDGIPDKYQVVVKFESEDTNKGTVAFDETVVTLYDADGNPAQTGKGHLGKGQVPSTTPADGYTQDVPLWTENGEAVDLKETATSTDLVEYGTTITGETTFVAHFAEDKISDPDDSTEKGDGIPDKFQKVITYKVKNGYWSSDATDNADIVDVVTLVEDGQNVAAVILNNVPDVMEGTVKGNDYSKYEAEKMYPIKANLKADTTVTTKWNHEFPIYVENGGISLTSVKKSLTVDASKLTFDLYEFEYKYNTPEVIPEGGINPLPGDDDPEDKPEDKPSVDPSGDGEDIPSDKPDVDPNGGSDVIDDGIDGDAMGGDKPITDKAEATPNGVKTGDETNVAPWAAGFGFAILGLGAAVALRRKEDEN